MIFYLGGLTPGFQSKNKLILWVCECVSLCECVSECLCGVCVIYLQTTYENTGTQNTQKNAALEIELFLRPSW